MRKGDGMEETRISDIAAELDTAMKSHEQETFLVLAAMMAVFREHSEEELGFTRKEFDEVLAACATHPLVHYSESRGYGMPGSMTKVEGDLRYRIIRNLKRATELGAHHPLAPLFSAFDPAKVLEYYGKHDMYMVLPG